VALNACELEIDLFCRGLRVPEGVSLDGARGIARDRAGLASGLEIAIPTYSWIKPEIWLNAPVVEAFVRSSPYELRGSPDAGYQIHDARTAATFAVRLPAEPAWYQRLTSRDVPMSRIGVLQGTHLSVYVNPVCAFWQATPSLNCRFCTTGNVAVPQEITAKTVQDVVETCWAAKAQSGVTFVQLGGGFMAHGAEFVTPFVRAIKQDVGLLVGVQLTPERELRNYDALIDLGADHFTFCIDLLDADWFARVCPGKARTLGQAIFFKAMEYCADRLPRGAVAGELIAGLEPVATTMEGIERILSAGAAPAICIFRPTTGSALEAWPLPSYEDMRAVMSAMYEACRRHHMPIGIAPNVEFSLIVSPDDAALLAPRTAGFYAYEAWRRGLRLAARPAFSSRLRARPRRISVESPGPFGDSTAG
jgi:hypothetical protein